jgi:uncharacterized SAM-binding protein YcdF (DUF218 family)
MLYVYLSKILPPLVFPVGLALIFGLLALLFGYLNKRVLAKACLILSLAILWISSMPVVASLLYGNLERQFPPVVMEQIPDSRCIVVLGGAVGPALPPRVSVELSESSDRVYMASKLYRAGKGSQVIVSGGNQPWSADTRSEAESMKSLMVEWGVPESAMTLEGASRNTWENAINTGPLLDELGCGVTLLVTSAAHMPRSIAAFQKQGIDVYPVSTDIRVIASSRLTIFSFIPNAQALSMTTEALREHLGAVVYQWRGWN